MIEKHLVKFTVGAMTLGVEVASIHQIIKPQEVHKLPQTQDYVEGVINLRGKVLPVINLRKRFLLEEQTETNDTKVIVISVDDNLVGFTVDAVTEIVRIPGEEIESVPQSMVSGINREAFLGLGKQDGRVVLILDLKYILSEDDIALVV